MLRLSVIGSSAQILTRRRKQPARCEEPGGEVDLKNSDRRTITFYPKKISVPESRFQALGNEFKSGIQMNARRLVSIVIPAQKPDFLEAALRSAFSQTHDAVEIIVCDDCPDDGVQQVLEQLRPDSPWPLRHLRNDTPLGESLSLVRGIREAQGEYIKFLHDDALLQPENVSSLLAQLESRDALTLVSSRRHVIDAHQQVLPDTRESGFPFSHDLLFTGIPLASFLGQFPVNLIGTLSCVMVRRADVLAFGDDLLSLNGAPMAEQGDLALYLKLLRQGDLVMLETALSFVRASSADGVQPLRTLEQARGPLTQRVNELGWAHSLDEYRMLKVSTLDEGACINEVDLLSYFADVFPGEQFGFGVGKWLEQRKINPVQQQLINERIDASSAGSSLLVVVLDPDRQTRKVIATLESILTHQSLSQDLNVVVLSASPVPEDFPVSALVQWRTSPSSLLVPSLNPLIESRACDWFMVVEAGAAFTAHGLSRVRLELPQLPHCTALFADELHRSPDGTLAPAFRPDFNLDFLLSYPSALSKHWIFHRHTFIGLGGFDASFAHAMELDLILRLIENEGVGDLHHLAEPLLTCDAWPEQNEDEVRTLSRHLQVRGYADSQIFQTDVGHYQIRYNHAAQPLVSILIPTKDQLGILSRCVESVLEKTAYSHYEIIIIDNNSEEADALEWLAGVESMQSEKVRVLRHPFPFNYSEINNVAAQHARGEYLVLLNNDTAVLHPEWLDNLLNHGLRPEVGIVGAKLYYPSSTIQHAGVVMGITGPAGHVFSNAGRDSAGYMQRLQVDQNYSVVTAACLMVRKSLYEEVAGLDEVNFRISYNDVDLCLKVREAGYLVVWTPHVKLLHESSVSQINTDTTAFKKKIERFQGEQLAMYRKWLPIMAADPAYNANFALTGNGFELETNVELTWRPLPWRPQPLVLLQRQLRWESADHRVTTPLDALRERALLDGAVSTRLLSIAEVERLRPAAIVFQQTLEEPDFHALEVLAAVSPALRVLDLDRLPESGTDDPAFLRTLGLIDRVVVPVPALAGALEGLHSDIRVVADYLPVDWKKNLSPQRRVSQRLRVGWCGNDPTLDLTLLAQVLSALATDVDFVVMGDCPVELRAHVREFHPQAARESLPAALTEMKLDLALLPQLDDLRKGQSLAQLLRFGACGVPVIACARRGDDASLPVTHLPADASVWIKAIRALIADADALAGQGDALRRVVHEQWVLDEDRQHVWRNAWLP